MHEQISILQSTIWTEWSKTIKTFCPLKVTLSFSTVGDIHGMLSVTIEALQFSQTIWKYIESIETVEKNYWTSQMDLRVVCESSLLWFTFMFRIVVRLWPLVALVIITSAKEGVRRSTIKRDRSVQEEVRIVWLKSTGLSSGDCCRCNLNTRLGLGQTKDKTQNILLNPTKYFKCLNPTK